MKLKTPLIAAALLAGFGTLAMAQSVGVSWSNFQEERWKTDEKAIKDQLAKLATRSTVGRAPTCRSSSTWPA